jgi:hypothetical protein
MLRNVEKCCAVLVVILCAVPLSASALSTADSVCRREIGKQAKKLAETLLKEKVRCHKLRMQSKISIPAADCNDPTTLPGALKILKAEQKLDENVAKKCIGASPTANLGYVLCPAPCETIAITGFTGPTSVAACIKCRVRALSATAIQTTYGSPPIPTSSSDPQTKCQGYIGSALRKYLSTRTKEQQKCQYLEDIAGTEVADCRVAQTQSGQKVDKALIKAKLLIAKCNATALALLDTCADTLVAEQSCVQAATEDFADTIFDDVYFPAPEAVFVSSYLNDPSPDGTVLKPFPTITQGIAHAVANSKAQIYIDGAAPYTEALVLDSNIYLKGGFNSQNFWLNDGTPTVVFSTSTSGMFGNGVSNTTVEGLGVFASSTLATGQSSYGVRLLNPSNVKIKGCTITAGNGGNGSSGSNGSAGAVGNNGGTGAGGCENSTTFCSSCGRPSGGGGGTNPACASGTNGGQGGGGGHCSEPSTPGGAGQNGAGSNPGSGAPATGNCHGIPQNGGNAGAVAAGTDGSGGGNFGSAGSTYVPSNGSSGGLGSHGSGGGGGAGGGGGDATCDSWGGGGGGGGSGGCRGQIATGGTGAGGSFGVWVSGGTATIEDTTINAGNGGNGGGAGVGGSGGSGTQGGSGGSGQDDSVGGANGGSGSNGGRGGHGGGGGGGPSIGIVCTGGAGVARSGNTVSPGSAGGGGSSAGNGGATGLSTNEHGC